VTRAVSLPLLGAPSGPLPARHWVLGTSCNLGCEFCKKQGAPSAAESVSGSEELVITGGEPMLVPGLLGRLRDLKRPLTLETNGALLHAPQNVARLAASGVRRVRLFLPGWDRESTDRIARAVGTGELQAQAARNLISAGFELAFVIPVTEEHARHLTDWLACAERLAERRSPADPIEIFLAYMLDPAKAPSPALELELGRLAVAAVRRSMLVRFDGPLAPAPCRFRRPEAFGSLFAGPDRAREKPEDCARCAITESCVGPSPGSAVTPLTADERSPVAYASAIRVLEGGDATQAWIRAGDAQRWGRENFLSVGSEPDIVTGSSVPSALLRPFFHCNEDCTFCWVDLEQPKVPDQTVEQTLALMALEGIEALSITGGEPTLDRRLEDQIHLARALGVKQLTLQTNAVRLDDPARVRRLAAAGLTRAFVSLHAADAPTNDAITRSRGALERTLGGVRNLLDAGISVGIGVVFTHQNRDQGRAIVQLLADSVPGVDLTFSVAQAVNDRLDASAVAPRYSEIAPTLRAAAVAAHEVGLRFAGLFGQCGVPPCILDADPICFPELAREHPDWSASRDFVHAPACEGCSLRRKCPGVRASYAAAHGTGELRPV
jgi:molybdenum cofactor biosynthesis enzyme MoaA